MSDEWDHKTTLATFMNEPGEAHAWFIGLCQTIHRVKPYRFDELVPETGEFPDDVLNDLKHEYTYYYVAFWLPRVIVLAVILSLTGDIWIPEACRILLELLKRQLGIS